MSTISRRAFLKTVGVGALSIAAVSVLAGCDVVPNAPVDTSKVIPAVAGRAYSMGECNVNIADTTGIAASASAWSNAFYTAADGFGADKELNLDATTRVLSWGTAAKDYTSDQKSAFLATCNAAANAKASAELVTIKCVVNNFSENDVALAPYASGEIDDTDDVKSNSTVFTANCNGTVLPCAVNYGTLAKKQKATVTVYVSAPVNVKEFSLTVAIPGAEGVLEYTIENKAYLDLSKL